MIDTSQAAMCARPSSPGETLRAFNESNKNIQIFVKTLHCGTLALDVDARHDTVTDVKRRISSTEHIPIALQRLILTGKELDNHRVLEDYNIAKEATLYLLLRLKGGGGGSWVDGIDKDPKVNKSANNKNNKNPYFKGPHRGGAASATIGKQKKKNKNKKKKGHYTTLVKAPKSKQVRERSARHRGASASGARSVSISVTDGRAGTVETLTGTTYDRDIVFLAAIDTSGSMSGARTDSAVNGLRVIAQTCMRPTDCYGALTFSSTTKKLHGTCIFPF